MCNCIDEDDDDDSKKKKKKQSTGDSKQVACGQSNLATYVVSLLRNAAAVWHGCTCSCPKSVPFCGVI